MDKMKRRVVSAIIVFVMVLGMVPAELVSVLAKTIKESNSTDRGTFTYNREVPEVAILNKYNAGMYNSDSTKTKDAFYDLLKGDEEESTDNKTVAAYPQYNAMRSLYGKEWSYTADFKNVSGMSYTVSWENPVNYKESTIKKLIEKQGNIALGISAKFINYPHEHHWGSVFNRKGAQVNTGLSMVLSMGGASSRTLYGQASLTNSTYTYSGWDQYNTLSYRSDDNGAITFSRSTVEIDGTDPCTCIGAKASQFLITMRDEKAPQITGFQYSTDGGDNWTTPFGTTKKTRVQAGGELLIKITYDEPIRFADDDITGKEDLYLGLMRNGKSLDEKHRAYLYKLDGDTLYYKYRVPSAEELSEDEKVLSFSQKSLFGKSDDGAANKTISLVHLWAGASDSKFTIDEDDVPTGYSTNGFTTSTCYITDLAGNPIEEVDLSAGELYIDTLAPTVAQVKFDAALNNEDVKQAKADYAPETVNNGDESDNYLGAGDRLDLTVILSEAISTKEYGGWEYAIAKTNIVAPEGYTPPKGVFVDEDDGVVCVKSMYFRPGEPGVYTVYPTAFVMYSLPIVAGMKIKEDSSNKNKELRVDAFYFSSEWAADITDLAGNAVDKTNVGMNLGANSNPLYLDTTPPTITAGTYQEINKTINGEPYRGFSLPVTIDKGDGTEVVSTYGKFSLSQKGDDRSYRFLWATNATGSLADIDEEDWKVGSTGNEYTFLQIGTTYFFIREYGDESYETLNKCTLTVKAKDYAGNVGVLEAGPEVIEWYVDKVAPSVAAGETVRKINGDRASVAVELTLTDTHDISAWEYAWTDSNTAEPTAWTQGDLSTSTESPVKVKATAEFDVGESFDKWLWVKATDKSARDDSEINNSTKVCVGRYGYDLSAIQYSITYSTAIEKYAKVKLESLGANDALVFMFPVNADENKYAVQVFKNGETAENIFAEGDWYQYTVTQENGAYKFERYALSDVTSRIVNGSCYGDLKLTMIKIKSAGLEYDESNPYKLTGAGENDGTVYPYTTEEICLRPASTTPWINYSDYTVPELISPDYISISSTDNLYSGIKTADGWADGDNPVQLLSTLAGVAFKIEVKKDKNGWECADIDTSKSKLVFKSRTDGHEVENSLGAFTSDGNGGFTQTVVAKGEYTTGIYDVYLRLVLVTGDTYELNYAYTEQTGGIVVDATEPNAGLKISKLTYDRYSLYWQNIMNIDDTVYPERDFANDDVIYLPVSGGFFDREVLGNGQPYNIYNITFASEGEPERGELKNGEELKSYTGQYYIEAWTKDDPNKRVKFYSKEKDQATLTADTSHGFTTLESQKNNSNYVFLKSDEANTVYVRKVYSNGGLSDTQTLTIWPVTGHIEGTMKVDKDSMQLVFTPTSAPETYKSGARVYAYAYQTGEAYRGDNCPGKVIEMDVSSSGGWVCPLLSGGAIYRVFTVNSYGSVWAGGETDYVCQRAPWIDPDPNVSDSAGFTDYGNGTYKWSLYVGDDMGSLDAGGVDLHISFNPEYFAEGYDLHLDKSDFNSQGSYTWSSTGRSATGIYKITASYMTDSDKDSEYIRLDIEGVVRRQEQDVQTAQTMNITLAATDNFGYTTTYSTGDKYVTYSKPAIVKDSLGTNGLKLEFNQAVYPVESWAWHEGDKLYSWLDDPGYAKDWEGAFPITGNGTYDVEYYDIFGNLCSTSLTTNAFTDANGYDWSVELVFSETEPTESDVYVTGSLSSDKKKANTGLIFSEISPTSKTLVPEGKYNGTYIRTGTNSPFDTTQDWSDKNKQATSSPRKVSVGENGLYRVVAYDTNFVNEASVNKVFSQNIHIDNIMNGPTQPEIYWYFSQLGTDMSQAEIEQYVEDHGGDIKLEGTAQVWYKTSRRVTPIDGTETVFLYTKKNQSATYTFKFKNEMGYSTEYTVSMPEGITLVDPQVPYVDCTAPTVTVAIASERFGKYTTGDSFLSDEAAADVAAKFANAGAAQGYLLTVNASDESGFEISVNDGGTVPEGISALGNQIFVDKAQSFEITVTDKSTQRNKTTVELKAEWFEKIDTTAPTVAFTTKQLDRYTLEITATLKDLNDAGVSTTEGSTEDTVTLSAPEGAVRTAPYTYTYKASTNGDVKFVFYDAVGNYNDSSKAVFKVQGIDTEPPVLDLTWWPPKTEKDSAGKVTVDYTRPTTEEVNTNVTAVIDADKPMYDVSLFIPQSWGEAATEYKMLEAGSAVATNNPYIYGSADHVLVEFVATPSRITVTVKDRMSFDSSGIYLIVTAANKKQTRIDLTGTVSVDKDAPKLAEDVKVTYAYYEKEPGTPYSKPYAAEVKIIPNEFVISTNYGSKSGTSYEQYSLSNPLVITFKENGSYRVSLTDNAGNTTIVPVEITGIDRTAPVLTVVDRQDSGQKTTVTVVADEGCTLTYGTASEDLVANGEKEIEFTDNGTYILTATDLAGNKTERAIVVGNIDKIAPRISFIPSTIYILQGSEAEALDALLNAGYTVSDDKSAAEEITVAVDKTLVTLDTAGIYTVAYTVTDKAGNSITADRFVQVIGENTVCVKIDDSVILPGETAVIKPGAHTLSLTNCDEPFSVKAKMGINGEGQMKYSAASSITFAEDGSFTVTGKSYYTLLVTTQSRKTVRILLCVGL